MKELWLQYKQDIIAIAVLVALILAISALGAICAYELFKQAFCLICDTAYKALAVLTV